MDQGVGHEIKRLREERGWSQARLAVEAEMSVSGVSMIESGQRNLTTTTLAKLARAFGLEIADLFPKAPAPQQLELEEPRGADEERRTLYLTTILEEARSLANVTEHLLGTMVRTFFDKIPDLPPVETVKLANGWAWRVSELKSHVFVETGRWETRVLGPLLGEDLPEWERELLNQIQAEFNKANEGVKKLHMEFSRRWSEAYEQTRHALNQEPLTVEKILKSTPEPNTAQNE